MFVSRAVNVIVVKVFFGFFFFLFFFFFFITWKKEKNKSSGKSSHSLVYAIYPCLLITFVKQPFETSCKYNPPLVMHPPDSLHVGGVHLKKTMTTVQAECLLLPPPPALNVHWEPSPNKDGVNLLHQPFFFSGFLHWSQAKRVITSFTASHWLILPPTLSSQ